ncbi:MAG: efflux RND transporter periplasmic adaptor subunit [Dysgonamonadaceae bacterium]|jgi:RND family efflux transporter MFP subunit|nr:efflux RND transporter periplasmic adaptor subunit [Dysgonamonadaceae bacterium]
MKTTYNNLALQGRYTRHADLCGHKRMNICFIILIIMLFPACNAHREEADHNTYDHREDGEDAFAESSNIIRFSESQAGKAGLLVELPETIPFGQVIKTTAQILSGQSDERIIPARTDGIVVFTGSSVTEGKTVSAGQGLFVISGAGLAENSINTRLLEAQSVYEKAAADYQRAQDLVKEKIVSEKEFLQTKSDYETAKAQYDNLHKHFSSSGQQVSSPLSGYIKQLYVTNGQYVSAGDALVSVSESKSLLLKADVPLKYAPLLHSVKTAVVRCMNNKESYTLASLNGKILSFGKSVNDDNFMLPVTFQIDNRAGFIPGSFVEIYIRTSSGKPVVTVPNTALTEEQGLYFVYVRRDAEVYEKREVQTGVSDGMRTEIVSGLGSDEAIVVRGAVSVKLAQGSGAADAHAGHTH